MDHKQSVFSIPSTYARGMKEQPRYKWWKPIVAVLLAFVLVIAFFLVLGIIVLVAGAAIGSITAQDFTQLADGTYTLSNIDLTGESSDSYLGIEGDDAAGLAGAFISVIIMIPAMWLSCKILGLGKLGRFSSVEGKLRWRRIAATFPWALLVAVVFAAISIGITFAVDGTIGEVRFPLAALIVIIILCPLQCAAEEYVFRGFLMQTFASWIPAVIIPLILQAVFFGIAHTYSILGVIGVAITGLFTGYLALKIGGIEASICMHTANNYLSFIMGAVIVAQETQSTVSAVDFGIDVLLQIAFLVVIYLVCSRKGFLLSDDNDTKAQVPEACE